MLTAAALVVLALYGADAATGWTGHAVHDVLRRWFELVLYLCAAAACVTRGARIREDRRPWLTLGAGITSYAAGSFAFVLVDPGQVPLHAPLASEILWAAFYPAAITAVLLLVAARAPRLPLGVWLDAGAAGLALAAVVCAVALPAIATVPGARTVALGLGSPCLDVVLVTLTLWVLSLARWRPHRAWVLLAGGFVLLCAADTLLAIRVAQGVFVPGELTSTFFPLAMVLLGLAAHQPPPPRLSEPMLSLRVLALPGAACLAAAAVLTAEVAGSFERAPAAMAVATLVIGFLRAATTVTDVRGLYESRRYARGFQDAALGMAIVSWDLRWLRVNPALCQLLRCSPEDMIGRSCLEVTHKDDMRSVEDERARAFVDAPDRSTFQKRYVRSDGATVDVEVTTSLIEDAEDGTYFYTQVQDISDRRRAERRQALVAELGFRALDVAEEGVCEYLRDVLRALKDGLSLRSCLLITAGADPSALDLVAHAGAWTGAVYPADSMAGWALSQRRAVISNDVDADTRFRVNHDVVGPVARAVAVPVRAQCPHVLVAASGPERDPFESDDAHFLESVANIVASVLDREAADRELRRRALVDGLTGLANRAMLDDSLNKALSAARRAGSGVCVLLLDLDNFKFVNDTLGHPAGDELLREIADRLRRTVRDEDLLARLGGDEFVVVCTHPDGQMDVPHMAGRLLAVLSDPFTVAGQELHAVASVGIAMTDGGTGTAADLLRDADVAMYRAKARPGNAYEVFDADLRHRVITRVALERDLREALRAEDQLVLHYQPLVELDSGAVIGFESLVRWQHPRDGMLPPDLFLPMAEETGLIVAMGERLIDAACARAAHWNRLSDRRLPLAVNLSSRQITSEVPRTIERSLLKHGVPAEQFVVEVTEHALLNPDVAVPVLERLREMGCRVALDDFGTGYSSLSYLETYPLDAIKLDRGFITRASEPRSAAILRAAVEMGIALDLVVIAEGIEHEEQRDLLRELGCELGQGYFFSRPVPGEEADALVADCTNVPALRAW